MPLLCWEIMKCPASHYLRCEPQKVDKLCWETEAGCFKCDKNCGTCKIYLEAIRRGFVLEGAVPRAQASKVSEMVSGEASEAQAGEVPGKQAG